jgi:secreted trypsin-like serine protease
VRAPLFAEEAMRTISIIAISAAAVLPTGSFAAPPAPDRVRSALARPPAEQAKALRALPDADLKAMARTLATITVVGGEVVKVNEFPWQVSLSVLIGSDTFKCGGTLVDARHVLTAAHCLDRKDSRDMSGADPVQAADVRAGFGSDRYLIADTAVSAIKVTLHPKWKATGVELDNDAALIELASDAPAVARAIPVRMVAIGPAEGPLWVSGWGRTQTAADSDFYGPLQAAQVTAAASCGYQLTPSMMCAGAPGKDSCGGDSGGPLVGGGRGQEQLVGIVSWGANPCARDEASGVYTRASAVADWVRTATGNGAAVTAAPLTPLFAIKQNVGGIVQ